MKDLISEFLCKCQDPECKEIGCDNLANDVCSDCKRGKHAGDDNYDARIARWGA